MYIISQIRNKEVHFNLNRGSLVNLNYRMLLENPIFLLNDPRFYFRSKEKLGFESAHYITL